MRDEIKKILDASGKRYCVVLTYEVETKEKVIITHNEVLNNFDTSKDPFDLVKFLVLNTQAGMNNFAAMMLQSMPMPISKGESAPPTELESGQYR